MMKHQSQSARNMTDQPAIISTHFLLPITIRSFRMMLATVSHFLVGHCFTPMYSLMSWFRVSDAIKKLAIERLGKIHSSTLDSACIVVRFSILNY